MFLLLTGISQPLGTTSLSPGHVTFLRPFVSLLNFFEIPSISGLQNPIVFSPLPIMLTISYTDDCNCPFITLKSPLSPLNLKFRID
ncbi:hypothetical protein HanRHA438_Chr12g0540161 [Helianthus annuus]|nr:hypothetical protein HanRHA438_Chr12g0540161 [Helianthus annuus]